METLSSGHRVGTTPELRELARQGREILTAFNDFRVTYNPRSKYDPRPWVSHGGDENGFRYSARECYAEAEPPTLEDYALAARHIERGLPGRRTV